MNTDVEIVYGKEDLKTIFEEILMQEFKKIFIQ